jgi:filamentous hemagglutinin
VPGAVTAFNADLNNRQLHQDEYDLARRYRRLIAQRLSQLEGRTVTEQEAEGRIVRQMQRNVDYQTAFNDGFLIDQNIVSLMGCQALKCNYSQADYFDTTVNAQYIPANRAAYNAALMQSQRGVSPQQLLARAQLSNTALGVLSGAYGAAESAYILLTGKSFAGEDESRWLAAAGVALLGAPRTVGKLYQLTHTDEFGKMLAVNAHLLNPSWVNAAGELTWINPLTNAIEAIPAGSRVHVDHILPKNFIERMPGFNDLTTEQKLKILNDPANLQPMLCSANCSKGARVEIDSGSGWATWVGQPVSDAYRANLKIKQDEIQRRINALLGRGG